MQSFGRRAYGRQRRVTPQQQALFIVESIRQHAQEGRVKTVEEYMADIETQQLVAALLQQQAA